MKKIAFLAVMALSAWNLNAWDTFWSRTYDLSIYDECTDVLQTADGGFLLAGFAYGADACLIRTSADGEIVWSRMYGGDGDQRCYVVEPALDGGWVVAGRTTPFGWDWGVWLMKVDTNGDSLWTRSYANGNDEACYDLAVTSDGGNILAGGVRWGNFSEDFWVIKTDANGDSLWRRTYAAPNLEWCTAVMETSDGEYILAGSKTTWGNQDADFWLVKIDVDGDSLWSRSYGGRYWDMCSDVHQAEDGGYFLYGTTRSYGAGHYDYWLINTNAQGDELWSRTYGGPSEDWCNSGFPLADGSGHVLSGYSNSFGSGSFDFWLVRTNSHGDSVWSRTYGTGATERCQAMRPTADGGLVLTGTLDSYGIKNLNSDFWLVKVGAISGGFGLTSPNGGEQWTVLSPHTVSWNSDSVDGLFRIELNRSFPSFVWELLVDSTEDDNEEVIQISGRTSDDCRIRISLIGDTLSDMSDADFSVIRSAGIVRAVRHDQVHVPVSSWFAGALEVPDTVSEIFRLRNLGTETVRVFAPLNLSSDEFSMTTTFVEPVDLAPNQVSMRTITLFYHPQAGGTHRDTLRVLTNALNGDEENFLRLPIRGELVLFVGESASLPTSYALDPVYPNPFNATATISYDLPVASHVSLKIFDVLGKERAVLVNETQSAARYRLPFDGTHLSSGVYLCRFHAGSYSAVQKVMLIK